MDEIHGHRGGQGWIAAVAQILNSEDLVVGAGFLVADTVVVTCAHVAQSAGAGPAGRLTAGFPHAPGTPRITGEVVEWRDPQGVDVAVIRLDRVLEGVSPLTLGAARGSAGHPVRSFGFPAQAPPDGHFAYCKAGEVWRYSAAVSEVLGLADANDLAQGFSGAPVVDDLTGLVIGMVTSVAPPDALLKGQDLAYATPTEVLRRIWPVLADHGVCPYLGLKPFGREHAAWFHGRDDAVSRVVEGLARCRCVLLLGPSGSGKSSLVHAGVLPALAENRLSGSDRWLPVTVDAGQDLSAELIEAALSGTVAADGELADGSGDRRVLLVIDQFEQHLAAVAAKPDTRDRFAAAVERLTTAMEAPWLRLIVVMRDDFYPQLRRLARNCSKR